jgi:hypothetical protein
MSDLSSDRFNSCLPVAVLRSQRARGRLRIHDRRGISLFLQTVSKGGRVSSESYPGLICPIRAYLWLALAEPIQLVGSALEFQLVRSAPGIAQFVFSSSGSLSLTFPIYFSDDLGTKLVGPRFIESTLFLCTFYATSSAI